MENPISPPRRREPWNKGRLIGQKRPLKPRDVWTIRVRLQLEGRKRAPSVPNDCWFGVMAPDKAPHGQLVATGPVAQWRVGMSLVVYPTKEKKTSRSLPLQKKVKRGPTTRRGLLWLFLHGFQGRSRATRTRAKIRALKSRCSIALPKVKPARFF
jgi:hypothetical protein